MLSDPHYRAPLQRNIRSRKSYYIQHQHNTIIAGDYRIILIEAKKLLQPAGGHAFERDLSRPGSETKLGLYAFMTPIFYWYLECDPLKDYQVSYAFANCPQEPAIRKLMDKFYVQGQLKEVTLQPDFATFYENVKRVQHSKHFYSLQG